MAIKDTLISILPKRIQEWIEKRNIKRLEASKDEKYRKECVSTGRMKEYETYKSHLNIAKADIIRFKGYIEKGLNPQRWQYELKNVEKSIPFIRPNDPKDIEYREYWREIFGEQLQRIAPENLDLRFHGTSIYNTKAILESGGIFSSVDINDGYRASTDMSGEISATSIPTINRTLYGWFADMGSHIKSLPCGCVFVLVPRTEKDQMLKKQDGMESVDFRKHPEQLYGIITTDENRENVREWLEAASLDKDLVTNFEGFLERIKAIAEKPKTFDESIVIRDPKTLENLKAVERGAGEQVKTQSLEDNLVK